MKQKLKELVKLNNEIKEMYEILPMNLEQAGYISSFVKRLLVTKGIDKSIIRRILIATYEAEINVVVHSYGGMCELNYDEENLKIIFTDTGPGIDSIEEAMKEGFSTASAFVRQNGFGAGMGLPNIRKAADSFSISSSILGTKIVIEFKLNN